MSLHGPLGATQGGAFELTTQPLDARTASRSRLGLLGLGTFAFGIVFFLLELFVAALQAYVFAILTAIYIQLAVADEH